MKRCYSARCTRTVTRSGAEKPVEGSKEATEAGGLHWYHGMTKGKGFTLS